MPIPAKAVLLFYCEKLASTVIDKASTALIGTNVQPGPVATPASKPSSAPAQFIEPPALAPPPPQTTFNGMAPMEPSRKQSSPQALSKGPSSFAMKPAVSLPEASEDLWGDWGATDVDKRVSNDNWANFAEPESNISPASPFEQNGGRSPAASWADGGSQAKTSTTSGQFAGSTDMLQPSSSGFAGSNASKGFADFPTTKPVLSSKPSLPPPMAPTVPAVPVAKPSLPPPLVPMVSKPLSATDQASLDSSSPKSESAKPMDDWADSWMQSVKTAPRASDRDKKKDERTQVGCVSSTVIFYGLTLIFPSASRSCGRRRKQDLVLI